MDLPAISSIATSLGAKRPCDQAVAWPRRHPIISQVVADKAAASACLRFLAEHRIVVERAAALPWPPWSKGRPR